MCKQALYTHRHCTKHCKVVNWYTQVQYNTHTDTVTDTVNLSPDVHRHYNTHTDTVPSTINLSPDVHTTQAPQYTHGHCTRHCKLVTWCTQASTPTHTRARTHNRYIYGQSVLKWWLAVYRQLLPDDILSVILLYLYCHRSILNETPDFRMTLNKGDISLNTTTHTHAHARARY